MPELPEVETVKKDLNEAILNLPISQVKILLPKIIKSPKAKFISSLQKNSFTKITRHGKFLIFHLKKGTDLLLVHLRMTGQIIFQTKNHLTAGGHGQKFSDIGKLPNKHTHLIFTFKNGDKLFYNDQRQFGIWELIPKTQLKTRLQNFGPDALKIPLDHLIQSLQSKKAPIKNLLLNQKLISGLGNIYASEILFHSHISPTRPGFSLSKSELKTIHSQTISILKKAIKSRGTTFSDFVDGKGRSGNFSSQLQVFGKTGDPCSSCKTKISKITQAGRSTFFCPKCQK